METQQRALTDEELDEIVRETWGNGWMLPGEPQRMLVRGGFLAGWRAAMAQGAAIHDAKARRKT